MQDAALVPLQFFMALRQKNYHKVWNSLTLYSQRLFIETLFRSLKPNTCSLERLQTDFEAGKGWAQVYWKSFVSYLDLDDWLSQNYKQFGISQQQVLVKATPANVLLLVIAEAGQWRFGYFETFLDH